MAHSNGVAPELDALLFPRRMSWRRRVATWLSQHANAPESAFLDANAERIHRLLLDNDHGLKMAVNISADALLSFLELGAYQNVYDEPVVFGERRKPSGTRLRVDGLQGLGKDARHYYCGAAETGGTGVRFYGEYCIIIRPDRVSKSTRLFERNPYDLIESPLAEVQDIAAVANALRGNWGRDRADMLALKVLPRLLGSHRLATVGRIGAGVSSDEDFVEIQRRGSFGPNDIYEIRIRPEEVTLERDIEARFERGFSPSFVEMEWVRRRGVVARELADKGVSLRMVTTSGRDKRWGSP